MAHANQERWSKLVDAKLRNQLVTRDNYIFNNRYEGDPKAGKVVVEKINMVSRHQKPRKQGEEGGIIQKEAPLYACKVQRVCPKCNKPTRPAHKLLADGKKVRVCKKCGAEI